MIKAEVLGDANFARRLGAAGKRVESHLQKRLNELGEEMVAEMQRLAPEDTGALRDSIRSEEGDKRPSVVICAGGTVETARPLASGHILDQAVLVELGTVYVRPRPFFRPVVHEFTFRGRISKVAGTAAGDAMVEIEGEP